MTLHLYLNDADYLQPEGKTLKGGATSFLDSWNENTRRRIAVQPKMGSVLVFQHANLVHAGDTLSEGTKYTLRTDLMYEMIPP
jgi:hypothetical protein